MIYHTLFRLNIRKDIAKCVVCCSRDWRFKGKFSKIIQMLAKFTIGMKENETGQLMKSVKLYGKIINNI